MKKINWGVIDFFCGCGGTSAGLQKSGMDILAGIDIDDQALATFQHNFSQATVFNESVSDLPFEALEGIVNGKSPKRLVFAACAPCQPFSAQNRLKTSDDSRISLLDEFHRFVEHFSPDCIILENVPGMQKVKEGPFTRFLSLLKAKKYHIDYGVKNAMNYGVPQSRKRLVLIASLDKKISLPVEIYGKEKLPYKTVRDAIAKYPELAAGESHEKIPNHACTKISEINITRIQHTPEGGDRRNWPNSLMLDCHKNHQGHNDVYGRLFWDRPSVTLTTKCTSISNGRFGHPKQHRALSVREAAAIQTFEDTFIFKGSLQETARQVGNAVPVLFAKAIGDQIISSIGETD